MSIRNVYRTVTIAFVVIGAPLVWGLYKCNDMNIEMAKLSMQLEGVPQPAIISRATSLLCEAPAYQNGFRAMVNNPLYLDENVQSSERVPYLNEFHMLVNASRREASQPALPPLQDILARKDPAMAFCREHDRG